MVLFSLFMLLKRTFDLHHHTLLLVIIIINLSVITADALVRINTIIIIIILSFTVFFLLGFVVFNYFLDEVGFCVLNLGLLGYCLIWVLFLRGGIFGWFCVLNLGFEGWSHHFVSKRNYHLIIPKDDKWNKPLMEESLQLQTHLLHGLIHCNGFGHLLCVNGFHANSKYLHGQEIMNLWDHLCAILQTRYMFN